MQVQFKQGDVSLIDLVVAVHEKAIEVAHKALEAIGVPTMPADVEGGRLAAAKDAIVKECAKRTKARSDWNSDMPIIREIVGDFEVKAEVCGTLMSACELYVRKCRKLQDAELKLGIQTKDSQSRIADALNLVHRLRGQGELGLEKVG